jgi:hypothetical protein
VKPKEAGIYRSEHFHSAGSVHFLTGVDMNGSYRKELAIDSASNLREFVPSSFDFRGIFPS